MNLMKSLIEMILTEAVALTKGSQRVMNDKNLVANLADAIRDDARSHPSNFPAGSARSFQKAPDEQLAQWFLENIDNIEREGYEGTVYSRDGANSDWIVRRYIAGSHNWEDLTGVMNMNLRDWYLLKNRNMLDPNHKDLPKFNSVRDVGYYMTTHYKDKLEKLRDAAKNAARNKMAKSIKLVDNDDYRIYTTLNRAAGCALGLGTQWCTANSNSGTHYHNYSNRAMLFQLFPYAKEADDEGNPVNVTDEDGKKELNQKEKYQFDASGPNFMNITDHAATPASIKIKYPYLFTDLSAALKEKKPQMEQAFKDLSTDPTLQGEDYKIKTYEIDQEIEKLHIFVDYGYFTDEVRPKKKAEKPEGEETPQLGSPATPPEAPEAPQMESIRDLARSLMNEDGDEDEELDEENEELAADAEATGGTIGSMGSAAGPTSGGGYAPGTAPTMPESLNLKGNSIMENVDKDVAAMLQSLKKYDVLKESVAPVLGMKTLGEKKGDFFHNPNVPANKQLKAPPKEVKIKEENTDDKNPWMDLAKKDEKKSGKTTKTDKGLKHEKDYDAKDDKEDVKEGADQEVLAWMGRFAKLGNMKGYGR